MTITRRLAAAFLSLAALMGFAAGVRAADYPKGPLGVIVPTPPGGGADTLARLTAQAVEPILHTSVIVENRPGAGGTIGTGFVARATPDGYTLGFAWNGPLTTTPNTTKVSYTRDSYTPIIEIGYASYVMCVAPDFPASNA